MFNQSLFLLALGLVSRSQAVTIYYPASSTSGNDPIGVDCACGSACPSGTTGTTAMSPGNPSYYACQCSGCGMIAPPGYGNPVAAHFVKGEVSYEPIWGDEVVLNDKTGSIELLEAHLETDMVEIQVEKRTEYLRG
uniref:Uncharacterized protein n=1 Tax=Pseudictyota dubia TaxID=2749911 RepID=A0A7R9Z711_9STRA|mmetsp:Transcript_27594/g.51283  ORF Transcript_27594/g.51283 Transcript_27594/m.51283 type:complete len:136 (+) Transcript_27594:169-576(+)